MTAYYNEFDPYAAQWLRNLISEGHIAKGEVDERSIEDITPAELQGYTQCHFFAGIGGWSYALRLAGWDDSRAVWTGSCPCQPFSTAGKGKGTADERHLWPAWFHLIRECRPSIVFGEQVEASINHGWLDLVQTDLEGEGYAFGAFGIPACGVEAPHRRQRLWFVADSNSTGEGVVRTSITQISGGPSRDTWFGSRSSVPVSSMGNADSARECEERIIPERQLKCEERPWADADWIYCRDQKHRPVESGTFPLADGISNRVGRLRAYGNAIVPQVAAEVIKAYMECRP